MNFKVSSALGNTDKTADHLTPLRFALDYTSQGWTGSLVVSGSWATRTLLGNQVFYFAEKRSVQDDSEINETDDRLA